MIERFYDTKVNSFVYKARYPILIISFIWLIISIIFTFQISPLREQEKFLPDDHPLTIVPLLMDEHFLRPPEEKSTNAFFWGTSGIDNSGIETWDSEVVGEVIINKHYDITLESSQLHY